MRGCHAIRRPSSNSTTSFTIEYGTTIFIDIPKLDPRRRRSGTSFASPTDPEPSMSLWRRGSASTAKIASGGALITRSTDTTSRFSLTAPLPSTRDASLLGLRLLDRDLRGGLHRRVADEAAAARRDRGLDQHREEVARVRREVDPTRAPGAHHAA